jgi:hypothetical protein
MKDRFDREKIDQEKYKCYLIEQRRKEFITKIKIKTTEAMIRTKIKRHIE